MRKFIVAISILVFAFVLIHSMTPKVVLEPSYVFDFAVVPDNSVTYLVFIGQKGIFVGAWPHRIGYVRVSAENGLVCEKEISELVIRSGEVKVVTLPCRVPSGRLYVDVPGFMGYVWTGKLTRVEGPAVP